MLEIVATRIWTKFSDKFDMKDFLPKDNGLPLTSLCAVQQLLVQVQNLYEAQRDQLRDQLTEQCKVLPRAYKEIQDLDEKLATTIRCIKWGFSKKPGSEESEAMLSFIRNNLASKHLKAYPNEAIWHAMNDTLNILSL